jgi:hypothetical protein
LAVLIANNSDEKLIISKKSDIRSLIIQKKELKSLHAAYTMLNNNIDKLLISDYQSFYSKIINQLSDIDTDLLNYQDKKSSEFIFLYNRKKQLDLYDNINIVFYSLLLSFGLNPLKKN